MKCFNTRIAGGQFLTMVPETDQELRTGMAMFKDTPPENVAMVFPAPEGSSFWMRGCSFGLDMLFLDMDMKLVHIESVDAESPGEIPLVFSPPGSAILVEAVRGTAPQAWTSRQTQE